jgi:hypothetical protein
MSGIPKIVCRKRSLIINYVNEINFDFISVGTSQCRDLIDLLVNKIMKEIYEE